MKNWKQQQIDELTRAQTAHRIQLGAKHEFAESALAAGHIPFSCRYMQAEDLATLDRHGLLELAKANNAKSHHAENDVQLVEAIRSAGPNTIFWTVAKGRTYWASGSNGPLTVGSRYRYTETLSGWHELLAPDGAAIKHTKLPTSLRQGFNRVTLNRGHLEEFRRYALERLALVTDEDCRPNGQTPINSPSAVAADSQWAFSIRFMARGGQSAARESGSVKVTIAKDKKFLFPSVHDAEQHIADLLEAQGWRCRLTGLPLIPRGTHGPDDVSYLPSLDRRDSNGHYVKGNLQVVCQFINQWKSASDEAAFGKLLDAVRRSPGAMESSPQKELNLCPPMGGSR